MQTFSFNPQINLYGDGKWFLAVKCFEATNSVFNITDEHNTFSIITPGGWLPPGIEGSVIGLKRLLELRLQNDIKLM